MKKRTIFALLLTIAMLFSACGKPEVQEPEVQEPEVQEPEVQEPEVQEPEVQTPETELSKQEITEKNIALDGLISDTSQLPKLDGSTACIPLMLNMLKTACKMHEADAENYVNVTGTQNCWDCLFWGNADLVLAYEMPDSSKEMLKFHANEISIETTPIGRDALVFLVNEENPITNLTQQQLIDIYTGKITDWSQLGGADAAIIPYQRDASSGSQTLFRKLLMGNIEPMEAPMEYQIGEMSMLVDAIGSYDNSDNALGYSVYYYVTQMKREPGVRLLAVDGITPTNETIADGTYPLTNDFFAAISSAEPEDSSARILYNWICSEEGRNCLIDAGYVPAQ